MLWCTRCTELSGRTDGRWAGLLHVPPSHAQLPLRPGQPPSQGAPRLGMGPGMDARGHRLPARPLSQPRQGHSSPSPGHPALHPPRQGPSSASPGHPALRPPRQGPSSPSPGHPALCPVRQGWAGPLTSGWSGRTAGRSWPRRAGAARTPGVSSRWPGSCGERGATWLQSLLPLPCAPQVSQPPLSSP